MDHAMKFFFIFCFAVFFLTGCNKGANSDKKVSVNGPSGKATGQGQKRNGKTIIDMSKLSAEEKKAVEAVAKQVEELRFITKKGDEILTQIWLKVWEVRSQEKATPESNVLRLVKKTIEKRYSDDGFPLDEKEIKNSNGFAADYILAGELNNYQIICKKCDTSEADKEITVATITRNDKGVWKLTFIAEHLKQYVGASLAMLKTNPECEMLGMVSPGMTRMICKNIGQNVGSLAYYKFDEVNFEKSRKNELFVKGNLYDEPLKEVIRGLNMEDFPLQQKFVIKGEHVPNEQELAELQKAQNPKTTAPANKAQNKPAPVTQTQPASEDSNAGELFEGNRDTAPVQNGDGRNLQIRNRHGAPAEINEENPEQHPEENPEEDPEENSEDGLGSDEQSVELEPIVPPEAVT